MNVASEFKCCGKRVKKNYCPECSTLYRVNINIKTAVAITTALNVGLFFVFLMFIFNNDLVRTNVNLVGAMALGLTIAYLYILQIFYEKILKDNQNLLAIFFGCHQKPDRSFFINGNKMAICKRCFGIALGVYIFIPIFYLFDLKVYVLALLILPLLIDGFSQLFTSYRSNTFKRIATGIMFSGFISFLYGYILYKIVVLLFIISENIISLM